MIKTIQAIMCDDFDDLVVETYGRPYCYQQQDGCRDRGTYCLDVPTEPCDRQADSIPEVVNGDTIGVSFSAWLARDPKAPIGDDADAGDDYRIELFWHRSFYPDVSMVVNDLHARGLLPAGEYIMTIDW